MPLKRPTATPLPDEIYDEWAPLLGEAELKVLLYIVRRTLGFRKGSDAISLTQFARGIVTRDGRTLDRGCGVTSRAALVRALGALEEKGLIIAHKAQTVAGDHSVTVYGLAWVHGNEEGVTSRGGSPPEPPGTCGDLPWFSARAAVVSHQNHGGSPDEPTTNSLSTNSQQDSMTPVRQPHVTDLQDAAHEPLTADVLWRAVLDDLRLTMTAGNYAAWLARTYTRMDVDDGLHVVAPTAWHCRWLDTRLRHRVEAALQRLGHDGVRVTFVVVP